MHQAGLFGVDLNKSSGVKVPEATGVVTGCVFLMITFLMIPATYRLYQFIYTSLVSSSAYSLLIISISSKAYLNVQIVVVLLVLTANRTLLLVLSPQFIPIGRGTQGSFPS